MDCFAPLAMTDNPPYASEHAPTGAGVLLTTITQYSSATALIAAPSTQTPSQPAAA